ncbi:hypothetical protein TRFO_02803 [Tritrichomonas foetus]|uniref:TPR Domain containing protein n=1 Tax=Tritrichomonas foetus TaxID=1144522 RepID=A0A1J4KW91_9EUKA|nr:hypothetical protein TRFO_02803 [Tritrichomonas foetus]|eukprot:OHT15495.1 hypothetical protein TRFO_02803 [Tritrichomonas foetus]
MTLTFISSYSRHPSVREYNSLLSVSSKLSLKAFTREYSISQNPHENNSIQKLRSQAEMGNVDSMYEYGIHLLNKDVNSSMKYLKKAADGGKIEAALTYVNYYLDSPSKFNDKELIPYLKMVSSIDIKYLKKYAEICLKYHEFFKDGMKAAKKCADSGDPNFAEIFGLLSLLLNNFDLSPGFKYAWKANSKRAKAITSLYEAPNDENIEIVRKLADNENDIISFAVITFYDLFYNDTADRLSILYERLANDKNDNNNNNNLNSGINNYNISDNRKTNYVEEPWLSFMLIGIGKLCLGLGKYDESIRFLQKAYDIGNRMGEVVYFLAYLRFYDLNYDRKETFEIMKKAANLNVDSSEYNLKQKFAYMMLVGDGCEKDSQGAADYLLKNKINRSTTDDLILGISLIESNRIEDDSKFYIKRLKMKMLNVKESLDFIHTF